MAGRDDADDANVDSNIDGGDGVDIDNDYYMMIIW